MAVTSKISHAFQVNMCSTGTVKSIDHNIYNMHDVMTYCNRIIGTSLNVQT